MPIARFLNIIIVEPLVSGFENTNGSTAFMLLFLVAIAVWIWHAGSSRFILGIASISVIFYLTQRASPFWDFYHFRLLQIFYVWDIVLLALVIPCIKVLTDDKSIQKDDKDNAGFIEEYPVLDASGDSFKRSSVAFRIAEMIMVTQNQRSFAIGIVGEYGSGKTSFINLIKKRLPDTEVEIIQYNPWSAEKPENISRDFFDKLAHHLYYLDPNLGSLITTYSRKLSRMNSKGAQIIQQLNSFSRMDTETDGTYNRINDLLRKQQKKVVLVIDDVDRLYNEEVIEVLKLIRNTANFANIVYLVAYDLRYVQEAIRSVNEKASGNFLDKIIQLEIPLPKRDKDDLLQLLESLMQPVIMEEHYKSLQRDIIVPGFKTEYELSFRQVFRNSRDVIRFVNSFQIGYPMLKYETLFENLFIIELLKFRFVDVYDLLYEQRSEWLTLAPKPSRHEEHYELIEFDKDGEKYLEIEKALAQYTQRDISLIRSLLKNLFNDYSRHKNAKHSIIHPLFFERYFRFRIGKTEISEYEFRINWQSGLEAVKQYINQMIKDGLTNEIADRLFQVDPVTLADFEQQIESIFYLGPKYVNEFGWTSFDDSALINKLWNFENEIAKKFYGGDVKAYTAFLRRQLQDAQLPFLFENDFIYRVKRSNKNIALPMNELINQQIVYFQSHVAKLGLTDEAMWILFGIRQYYLETSSVGESRDWQFEPEVIPVAREVFATQNPVHFLRYSIYFEVRDKRQVMVEPHILQFFDNAEQLRMFVAQHPLLEERLKMDYLAFFDKWKAAGPGKLVEHYFLPELARIVQNS